jgi:hypothetical protein
VCTNYTGDDPQAYMQSVTVELAASYCSCKDPPKGLVHQFAGVQFTEMGASELCMEFTVYSGNPNTTAQDIVNTLEDNPPPGFTVQTKRIEVMELCADAEKGCNLDDNDGNGGSLVYVVIGVACSVLLFLLGIAWYVIHKQIRRQWSTRTGNMVRAGDHETLVIRSTWLQGENENVSTFKSHADATGLHNSAPSRDGVITMPFDQEGKTSAVYLNNLVEIHIPPRGRGSYSIPASASFDSSKSLPPRVSSLAVLADTAALKNNDNVVANHDDHLGPAPAIKWSSDENREKSDDVDVGSSISVATSADLHNSMPDLPGSLAQMDDPIFSSSSSSEN